MNESLPRADITRRLLAAQLQALGSERFEFGVKCKQSGKMARRSWTLDQAINNIDWLKYSNANGQHIYVRPEGSDAVILIDDLQVSSLLQMEREGVRCACVVETSPFNHQAWVRVSNSSLSPRIATLVGEILATRYNGDQGSKDFRHLGRAVGFTNLKPEHIQENGLFPYVKLIESEGVMTPNGDELLAEAAQLHRTKELEHRAMRSKRSARRKKKPGIEPEKYFENAVAFINEQYGLGTDGSRADASAALHMHYRGYNRDEIEAGMLANIRIHERRKGHVEDYVRRTITWALNNDKRNGK